MASLPPVQSSSLSKSFQTEKNNPELLLLLPSALNQLFEEFIRVKTKKVFCHLTSCCKNRLG
jgi:hypothetical protein